MKRNITYDTMILHKDISDKELREKIKEKEICFGGNSTLKIYGTLRCKTGKRMKRENLVFFNYEKEAIEQGYRPCGNCMVKKFREWKIK